MVSLGQVDNYLPGAQPCALGIFAWDHIHLLCKRHLNPLDLGAATPKTPGLACKAVLGLGRLHSRSRFWAPRGIVLLVPVCQPLETVQRWPVLGLQGVTGHSKGSGQTRQWGRQHPGSAQLSREHHVLPPASSGLNHQAAQDPEWPEWLEWRWLSVRGWSHRRPLMGTKNTQCSVIHLLPPLEVFCDEELICSSKRFLQEITGLPLYGKC